MARSMPGTRDACQMPCVSNRAEMSGARDAAMMRAFRHECGILCAILTGLMGFRQCGLAILDPIEQDTPNKHGLTGFDKTKSIYETKNENSGYR